MQSYAGVLLLNTAKLYICGLITRRLEHMIGFSIIIHYNVYTALNSFSLK